MADTRQVRRLTQSRPTLEGAGVHLRRAFGFDEVPMFDPFLLLDDFRSGNPDHYLKGFPWHPHRGIETISYVLRGQVAHGDSMGNKGVIGAGDVQWMTAGSGIIHQEMPTGDDAGVMWGFQLWANLPAAQKMMGPRYREVTSVHIPEVALENGSKIRVICGTIGKVRGPVRDIVTEPEYLDVSVPANSNFIHPTPEGHTVFVYVIGGKGRFGNAVAGARSGSLARDGALVLFADGRQMMVTTQDEPLRFLLISGKPIGEPVAWYGPIVMNTQEELELAFEEYKNGTFIKDKK